MEGTSGTRAGSIPARVFNGPEKELIRRISARGPVTFAEFMDVALYWPDGGYYTSADLAWGAGGDYITSLDVSPVFSAVLARQVSEIWSLMGSPADFVLIEAGAGRGWLSQGILETIKKTSPGLYSVITVRCVEKNPSLRGQTSDKMVWHEDIKDVQGPVRGVILTNELIDSLPVHRVKVSEGLLKEVFTGFDGRSFFDVEAEPSTPHIKGYFDKAGLLPGEGALAEVNLDSIRWLSEASALLAEGFIITIDYGLPSRELYAPERKAGTLMCHYRHTLNDNPYLNIGHQDITTHVDFTALVREGERLGLGLTGFTTQKNFLLGVGILEDLRGAGDLDGSDLADIEFNRAVGRLIMPGGMGDTFKVLIQHKGVERHSLAGFSFRDMSRCL